MSRYLHSVEAIEAELLRRLKDLLADPRLGLNDGERRGHEWAVRLPGRTKRGSMSVNLNTGVWSDFSSGGGARTLPCLGLISHFACGGRFIGTRDRDGKVVEPGAIDWAKDWLGWSGKDPDPAEIAKANAQAVELRAKREREEASRARGKLNAAFQIWLEARRLTSDDPASRYLMARGIDPRALPDGRFPRSLKFHAGISHPRHPERLFPALIACMSLEGRAHGFAGIHRIYLELRAGVWGKAFGGEEAKLSLAYQNGASIRLSRGASGKRLDEAPAGEWVCVTEGVEDGCALAIALPENRVLAVYALNAMGRLSLPPHIGGVTIVGDNDEPRPDRPTDPVRDLQRNAEMLAERHEVRIAKMPAAFKDVNDALIGKTRTIGGAA